MYLLYYKNKDIGCLACIGLSIKRKRKKSLLNFQCQVERSTSSNTIPPLSMNSIRNLARRAIQTHTRRPRNFSSKPLEPLPEPATHNGKRFGPNGAVGAVVFSFVGGVYYYTVFQLRRQGNELMDELDELEKEIQEEK